MDKVYLEQARLLLRLLPLIDRHHDFALKGGTAINFFIRDLPRLSVDIDLTYLPVSGRESALRAIGTILNDVAEDASGLFPGLKVTTVKSSEDGRVRKLILRLAGLSVKIEPSIVLRGSVFGVEWSGEKRFILQRQEHLRALPGCPDSFARGLIRRQNLCDPR